MSQPLFAQSSEQNALYVSYWLPCFIHHACHVAPEVDIDVEDMLKILLGESESLLESVITPDVVGQFVGVLDSPYLVRPTPCCAEAIRAHGFVCEVCR